MSFINPAQRDVIDNILTHGGLASRAPPPETRGPPAPPIRELTYVRDLELIDLQFVPDPGHPEPVWSPDCPPQPAADVPRRLGRARSVRGGFAESAPRQPPTSRRRPWPAGNDRGRPRRD
ncbi:MAG: hypothetical protein ACYSUF_00525 [Planctomycetota bacterium]